MKTPRAIKRSQNDFLKRSLLTLVTEKCTGTAFQYMSNNQMVSNYLPELKRLFEDEPEFLHNVIWERLSSDEEIQSAFAHVKASASITTEFFNNEMLFSSPERIYLDMLIMDVVGWSEPQKMRILNELVVDYARGLTENLEVDKFLDAFDP